MSILFTFHVYVNFFLHFAQGPTDSYNDGNKDMNSYKINHSNIDVFSGNAIAITIVTDNNSNLLIHR